MEPLRVIRQMGLTEPDMLGDCKDKSSEVLVAVVARPTKAHEKMLGLHEAWR